MTSLPAREALERLQEGNRRFVSGARRQTTGPGHKRGRATGDTQDPFAIIVGCSDSRVPPEHVFDQDVGDLFVVRAAGNVVGPTQAGSVEFAAVEFGTRLIVVLGHSRCGAIQATCSHLREPTGVLSPNLQSIIDLIRPSIEPLLTIEAANDLEELRRRGVRANVDACARRLRSSAVIGRLIEEEGLLVVGAEYSLETGTVEFLDDSSAG